MEIKVGKKFSSASGIHVVVINVTERDNKKQPSKPKIHEIKFRVDKVLTRDSRTTKTPGRIYVMRRLVFEKMYTINIK
jgi:hypothetical protein